MNGKSERLSIAEMKQVAEEEGISLLEARKLIKWRLRNDEAVQSREAWDERVQRQEDRHGREQASVKQQQNKLRETLGLPLLP